MKNRNWKRKNEMKWKLERGYVAVQQHKESNRWLRYRPCYCSIAIKGPTNPPVASPLFPFSFSYLFSSEVFSSTKHIFFFTITKTLAPQKKKKFDIEITEKSSNNIEYEMMVGLSVVLEGQKGKKIPQVINKTTMLVINMPSSFLPSSTSNSSQIHPNFSFSHPPPFLGPTFLDQCFLCKQKLLPGKDIYMYKGDRGFCSVECRYRQIFMDEEETFRQEKHCSMAASSSSSSAANQRRGAAGRNRAGGFAY